jgi:hypothetical protein
MKSSSKQSFKCNHCLYITTRKNDFEKHKLTAKHKKRVAIMETGETFFCKKCNYGYKHLKSLLRHEKTCKLSYIDVIESKMDTLERTNSNILNTLEKTQSNNELLYNKISDIQQQPCTINNITVNNKFNINVLLNTHYKNAISLEDFKACLKLTLDDLLYTKDNGYVKGITNIFIKNLEELGPSIRPIHCSNPDNSSFYVKSKDNWVEDIEHIRLNLAIDNIAQAQLNHINECQCENKEWSNSEKGKQEYLEIVKSIMGGTTNEEKERDVSKIKHTLGHNLELIT